MRALVLALLLIAVAAPAADAATFAVTKTADTNDGACDGDCSLREAILAAKLLTPGEPDTITLGPGVHDNTGADFVLAIGEQLTITGAGARTTTIRELSGGDGRVFLVEQDARLTISDATVTGAQVSNGVLVTSGATLEATRMTFSGNSAPGGGGAVANSGGSVTVSESTITGNGAGGPAARALPDRPRRHRAVHAPARGGAPLAHASQPSRERSPRRQRLPAAAPRASRRPLPARGRGPGGRPVRPGGAGALPLAPPEFRPSRGLGSPQACLLWEEVGPGMWCVKLSDSQRDALRALVREQGEAGRVLTAALEALDLARWDDLPEATLPWERVSEMATRQGIGEADVVWDLAGPAQP